MFVVILVDDANDLFAGGGGDEMCILCISFFNIFDGVNWFGQHLSVDDLVVAIFFFFS